MPRSEALLDAHPRVTRDGRPLDSALNPAFLARRGLCPDRLRRRQLNRPLARSVPVGQVQPKWQLVLCDSAMDALSALGAFVGAVDDGGYKALLTVHILCAIPWVGSGIMITLQAERARVAKNETELVNVVKQADFFATRMFIPLSLVVLGVGLGMIAVGHVGFNHPLVMIALTGWALSFLIGAGFLGPQSEKAKKLVAVAANGSGVDVPAEAMARIRRIVLVARLDLVILALVVINMVVKPGGGIK